MSNNTLGDVSAGIGLDTSNFERGVRIVTEGMNRLVGTMRKSANDAANTAKTMSNSAADIESAFKKLNIRSNLTIEREKKEIQAAFNQIKSSGTSSMNDVKRSAEAMRREMERLNAESNGTSGSFLGFSGRLGEVVGKLGKAYLAIKAIQLGMKALTKLFGDAVMAVNTFEMSVTAQAAVITSMQAQGNDPNFDLTKAYKENVGYARQTAAFLEQAAVETLANSANIQIMNNRLVLQGVLLDTTNEKAKQGFKNIANALQVMAWRSPNKALQFDQEIRAMFDGQIRMSDQLAREVDSILKRRGKGLKESLKEWGEMDPTGNKAVEEIGNALVGFTAASGDIKDLWTTISSALQTLYNQVLRGGLQPFFEWLVDTLWKIEEMGRTYKTEIQTGLHVGWLAIKGVIMFVVNLLKQNTGLMKVIAGFVGTVAVGWANIAYVIFPQIGKFLGGIIKTISGMISTLLSFLFLLGNVFNVLTSFVVKFGTAVKRALVGDIAGAKKALSEIVSDELQKSIENNAKLLGESFNDVGEGLNDAFNWDEHIAEMGDAALELQKVMKPPNAEGTAPPYVQPFPDQEKLVKLIEARRNELALLKQSIEEAFDSEATSEFERAIERASSGITKLKMRLESDMKGKKPEIVAELQAMADEVEGLRNSAISAAAIKFINKQIGEVEERSNKAAAALKMMRAEVGSTDLERAVHKAAVGFEQFAAKMNDTIQASEDFYASEGIPMPSHVAARLLALREALNDGLQDAKDKAIATFTYEFDRDIDKYVRGKNLEIGLRLSVSGESDIQRTIAEIYDRANQKAREGIGTENFSSALNELQITEMLDAASKTYSDLANNFRDDTDRMARDIELASKKAELTRNSGMMGYDSPEFKVDMARLDLTAAAQPRIDLLNEQIGELELPGATEEAARLRGELENLYGTIDKNAHLKVRIEVENFDDKIAKLTSFRVALREFADASTSALSDFFMTWMETGKLDFSGLAQTLLRQLQIMAAQRTAILLMEAAYQAIMSLISPMGIDPLDGRKHSAKAIAALTGASLMGGFVVGSGLAGMAHDGMSSIPEDGTWLLKKGERVVNDKDNKRLGEFLEKGAGGVNISMPVTINGGDEQGVMKALPALRESVIQIVSQNILTNGDIKKTMMAAQY